MRFFAWTLFLSLFLFTPAPQPPATFPIPADMHETWPGAKLNDADTQLLQKAVNTDLRDLDEEFRCEKKSAFDGIDSADVDLGKLGKGVLVRMSNSCACGATGICPIYAYARDKERYRRVLGNKRMAPGGWAFGVVSSKAAIPDLVIAGHLSAGQIDLSLYRYAGDSFAKQSCEILTKKDPESQASWWDPSAVAVEPCFGK